MNTTTIIETMTKHYLICAEWADKPENENWGNARWSDHAWKQAENECEKFYRLIRVAKLSSIDYDNTKTIEQLGHDFYLTRNSNGAGFWDGKIEWNYEDGDKLTEICRNNFDEINIYCENDIIDFG